MIHGCPRVPLVGHDEYALLNGSGVHDLLDCFMDFFIALFRGEVFRRLEQWSLAAVDGINCPFAAGQFGKIIDGAL